MGKLFRRLGSIVALSVVLAGCSNTASTPSLNEEEVTDQIVPEKTVEKEEQPQKQDLTKVTIWHQYEPKIEEGLKAAFDVFSKENPQIQVELIKQNELANKVTLTGQSQKDAPDIICGPNDWAGRFSIMGIIEPVTEYMDTAIFDEHLDTTKQAIMYQDNIYGVPLTYECLVLMYNKALLQSPPTTTDELLVLMKDQTKEDKWGFITNISDAYHVMPWIYGNGGYPIDEEGLPGLDTEGMVAALKFVDEMKAYLPKNIDYGVMDGLFKEGKTGAIINGSWAIGEYKEIFKDEFGIAPIPTVSRTGKPGQPFLGVQAAFVSPAAVESKEAVGKVLTFFGGKEVGEVFADNGYLTSNQKVEQGSGEEIDILKEQAKMAVPMPAAPEMSQCWEPIANALKKIIMEENPDYNAIAVGAQKDALERIESMK